MPPNEAWASAQILRSRCLPEPFGRSDRLSTRTSSAARCSRDASTRATVSAERSRARRARKYQRCLHSVRNYGVFREILLKNTKTRALNASAIPKRAFTTRNATAYCRGRKRTKPGYCRITLPRIPRLSPSPSRTPRVTRKASGGRGIALSRWRSFRGSTGPRSSRARILPSRL